MIVRHIHLAVDETYVSSVCGYGRSVSEVQAVVRMTTRPNLATCPTCRLWTW